MDLTQDVTYRGFKINDSAVRSNIVPGSGIGSGISGCVLDSVDLADADVVQFLEKRSLQDGMDAGDVYLGARRIRMAGTMYGLTRALLFDSLQNLRDAFSPTLAFREVPADKGYQPLYYSEPTNNIDTWPLGAIDKRVLALPRGLSYVIQRNTTGGADSNSLAIPWQGVFVCRDPAIMAVVPQEVDFTPTSNASGNLTNRGSYHCPLNAIFEVTSHAGTIVITAGGSTFTLTIPSSTGTRIIRVKGQDKIVTIEEESGEVLRMDVISFNAQDTWPLIPSGDSAYSVVFGGGLVLSGAGSQIWFWEQFS